MAPSNNEKSPPVSRFRCVAAQVLATSVKNLLLLDVGLCFSLPSIVVAALTGNQNAHNRDEFLSISPVQASWLGSLTYLVLPIGSIIAALVTDTLGRKRSMILVNIPYFLGWFVLWHSSSVNEIILGFILLGLAVGLMEAAVVTYLGEICEPSTRGVLIGLTFICATIGMFTTFVLNTLMPWRSVCMVCSALPVISALAVFFIPETPQWLLSKNRVNEAEKSLCWLRGWASSHTVSAEFHELQEHSVRSKSCTFCEKQNLPCSHPSPTVLEKLGELKRRRTIKPLTIILVLFLLAQFSGTFSMRPFIVQIFKAYDSPIEADQAVALMSLFDNMANVLFMCLVRFTGKRRLYLTMLSGVFLCSLTLTIYGFMYLPSGYVSFNQKHEIFHMENPNLTYIPLVCLVLWSFFTFCGFSGMPWMFLSELFSFKSRCVAGGIAAAINYMFGFISKKTYYNIETGLSLPGSALFYSIVCGFGLIFTYLVLPETEGLSLEDIEHHFSDNSKSLMHRKITKRNKTIGKIDPMTIDVYFVDKMKCNENGYDNKAFESECSKK